MFGRDGLSACMQGILQAAKTEDKRAQKISEAERSKGFSLGMHWIFNRVLFVLKALLESRA